MLGGVQRSQVKLGVGSGGLIRWRQPGARLGIGLGVSVDGLRAEVRPPSWAPGHLDVSCTAGYRPKQQAGWEPSPGLPAAAAGLAVPGGRTRVAAVLV